MLNNTFEITIGDLRRLGVKGDTTVRLKDGTEFFLTRFEARSTTTLRAFIGGQCCLVVPFESFWDILPKIRTIKRQNEVVARIDREGKLRSTGKGYHRPTRRTK